MPDHTPWSRAAARNDGDFVSEPDLGSSERAALIQAPDPGDLGLLYGTSPAIRRVRQRLATVAARARRVRLEGERGTGKNLAAQFLHGLWRPPGARFAEVNLAWVSAGEGRELGELCGWSHGAFTGAVRDLPGLLEMAHDGTAFFNEVGTASPNVQKILLRLLEQHDVQRLGERRQRRLELRIITATNESLETAVRRRQFREDLFDRLGHVVVSMPPLRDRLEDLPDLAAALMRRLAAAAGVAPLALGPAVLDRLLRHRWPGNVRELESTIEVYLTFGQLPEHVNRITGKGRAWRDDLDTCVAKHHGNMSAAARELGVARSRLYEAMEARTRREQRRVSASKRRGHLSDTPARE